jgi:hypothetical protein
MELAFDWRSKRFLDASAGLAAFAQHLGKKFDDVPQIISRELRLYLEGVVEALEQRHGQSYPGGTGAKSLSRRSGFMLESIRKSVKVDGSKLSTIVGTITVPGTRKIHEHGGVLRAKKAKYLTIPLPAALNANGTPKKPSARAWSNTFVLRSKAGNLLIVQKQGTQIIPLYVLKPEVYIPPRLGLLETARAGTTLLADRLTDAILKELQT